MEVFSFRIPTELRKKMADADVSGDQARGMAQASGMRLEEQILALIGEHPDGIRLTDIAERTVAARIRVGNVTRMLVDEGKIRKEGMLYFPLT